MKLHYKIIAGYHAGQDRELDQDRIRIHRGEDADIRMHPTKDLQVGSSQHAEITRDEHGYTVKCVHANGVTVFDHGKPTTLAEGESVTFTGDVELVIGKDGPRVRCIPIGVELPATMDQASPTLAERMPVTEVAAGTIQKAEKSSRRIALVALIAVLSIVGLVGGYLVLRDTGEQLTDFEQDLEDSRDEARALREANDQLSQGLQDQAGNLSRLGAALDTSVADLESLNRAIDANDARLSGMQEAIALTERQVAEIDAEVRRDFSEVLREHSRSVAVVGIIDQNGNFTDAGTGWIVSEDAIATNAHVAVGVLGRLQELGGGPNYKVIARFVGEQARDVELDLDQSEIHAAYAIFFEEIGLHIVDPKTQSLARVGPGGDIEVVQLGSAYDVAYLRTKTPVGPALPLASEQQLRELDPGEEIAYIGYPSEGLLGARINAPPEIHIGRLTSMTNFASQADAFERALILNHTLPSVGGASGSPIFSKDGLVVGLLSHGAVRPMDDDIQVRVGLGFNHAQRVSLLHELLSPPSPAPTHDDYRAEIRRQIGELNLIGPIDRAYIRTVFAAQNHFAELKERDQVPTGVSLVDNSENIGHTRWSGDDDGKVFEPTLAPGRYIVVCGTSSNQDISLIVEGPGGQRVEADETTWLSAEALFLTVPGTAAPAPSRGPTPAGTRATGPTPAGTRAAGGTGYTLTVLRNKPAQDDSDLIINIYPVR